MNRPSTSRTVCLLALAALASRAAADTPAGAERAEDALDVIHCCAWPEVVPADHILRGMPVVVEVGRLKDSDATLRRPDLLPVGTASTETLSQTLPGLQVNTSGALSFNDTVSLRGMSNTPIFGPAAVATYLDEMPLGGPFTLPEDLSLLGTVVLHYGPSQGSAFGRSGPAGLLELRSLSLYGGRSLSLGAGSHGAFGASAYWMSWNPVQMSVAVAHSRRDGYVLNTGTGERLDDKDRWSALLRFQKALVPAKLFLSVTALVQRAQNGEQPMVPLFGGDHFKVERSTQGRSEGHSANVGGTLTYQAPWGKVSSTTSMNDWSLTPYVSILSFGPMELTNDVSLKQRNFNEELRFNGEGAGGLAWKAGLFGSDGNTDGDFVRSFGPMTYESSSYHIDGTQAAVFGELTSRLRAGLSLGLGLRGQLDRSRLLRMERVPMQGLIERTERSSALLPRVSLRWEPGSRQSIDFALVTGYKPGGVSAFTGNAALTGFGAERLAGAELGYSASSSYGGLSASLRAHLYEISGYQIERSFATGGMADDYLVVNAPRARALGLETSVSWTVMSDLSLTAQAGLERATLRDFTDPYTQARYDGFRVPYVPVGSASLAIDYGRSRGWFAGVRASLKGRIQYTEGEEAMFSQASRTLLSASAGYGWRNARLSVYGDNLSDRRYWSSIAPGTYHGTPGAPLTWGAQLSLSF